MFLAYGRVGTQGYQRQTGTGREMCRRGEDTASDFREESGSGPDADSGHAGQNRVKRVSKNPLLHLKASSSLCLRSVMSWSARQDNDSSIRAGNDDGLLSQYLGDVCSKTFPRTRSKFAELGCQLLLAQRSKFFW